MRRSTLRSVLFIDPGKMTGAGVLRWGPDREPTFEGWEQTHDDFCDWLASSFTHDPIAFDRIVIEGFSITERTVKIAPDDRELWSVKQIGLAELLCRWYGVPFERQMPSDKSFAEGRAKLEALDWWKAADGVKGEAGHRRDAARHAIRWGVHNQIIDPRKFL